MSATMGDVYNTVLLPSHDTYDVRGALQMPTRAQERDQCPRNIKNTIISQLNGRAATAASLYLGLIRMKWSCSMGAFEILLFGTLAYVADRGGKSRTYNARSYDPMIRVMIFVCE